MPPPQETSSVVLYQHHIVEASVNGTLPPEETSFAEIREFIEGVTHMRIGSRVERQFRLEKRQWGYLYLPYTEVWTFIGSDQEVPQKITDATAVITVDAALAPGTNGPRKGIQISGIDAQRPVAVMYDQKDGSFVRADIGVLDEELSDPDLFVKAPQYAEYEMAGTITLAMLASDQREHTRLVRVRGRLPNDSTRNLRVEGKMEVLKIRDFTVLPPKGDKLPYSYQIVTHANQVRGMPQTIAFLQPNLAA